MQVEFTQGAGDRQGTNPVAPGTFGNVFSLISVAPQMGGEFFLESAIKKTFQVLTDQNPGFNLHAFQRLRNKGLQLATGCTTDGLMYFLHGRRARSECGLL